MQWFEDQLSNINQQFHETLSKRKEETEQKLEVLNKRITDLDKYFEEQKAAILKYIDDRGEELTKLLNQFKVTWDAQSASMPFSSAGLTRCLLNTSSTGRIRRGSPFAFRKRRNHRQATDGP